MYLLSVATLDEPHSWNDAERWVRDGFGRGRCGGGAPAQGRAEGPTAQMQSESIEECVKNLPRLSQGWRWLSSYDKGIKDEQFIQES